MTTPDTKNRILDTAEALFAENGFVATSVRAITAAAGVNLAAVHYHFGSKKALFQEVYSRRFLPINEERLKRLDALESHHGDAAPPLGQVLEALLHPALRMARTTRGTCMKLAGRAFTEPGDHWVPLKQQFDRVKDRYLGVLRRILPSLSNAELHWRVHFMVGAVCHTLAGTEPLREFSGGLCNPSDVDAVLEQLMPFLAAGFRAPAMQE